MGIGLIETEADLQRWLRDQLRLPDTLPAGGVSGSVITIETITGERILPRTLRGNLLVEGTITAEEIAAHTIIAENIAAGTITAEEIAAHTIIAENIAAGTITATEIEAGSITTPLLAAGAITAEKVQAGTITATEIAAGTITGTLISANTITGENIAARTVSAGNIVAGTITSAEIASGTITGGNIASGTVTASNISVSKLSALSADMGEITAGTVTGATLRTASSGNRVVIDSTGLHAYKGISTAVLDFDIETGNLKIKGTIEEGSTIPAPTITGLLTSAQIEAIAAAKITGTLIETQIGNEAISTGKLAANAVTSAKIAAETITAEDIAAGTITGTQIKAETITAAKIAAGTITTTQIAAATILGEDIAATTITGSNIAASTIAASKLSVTELSAITANLGTITAGTITGATFRTSGEEEGIFDGTGLRFKATTTEVVGAARSVRWLNGGTLVASLYGQVLSSIPRAALLAEGTEKSQVELLARGTEKASLFVTAATTAAGAALAVTFPSLGSTTVLNGSGQSAFLQLTAAAKRKINFGTATVKWAGSKSETEIKEVAHGLGAAAVVAFGGSQTTNTFFVTAEPSGTEKIKLQGYAPGTSPPAGTERTIYWIAIG